MGKRFTIRDLQVLISGTSSNQKFDKSSKANRKEEKSRESSESHVELDSRLLSSLLTVSMIIIPLNIYELILIIMIVVVFLSCQIPS